MKAKSTVFLTVGIVLTALLLVTVVSARMMPTLAHTEFFEEISAAEVESASALFAEDAVINNNLTGDSYAGQAAIAPLLESWVNDSRSYEVVTESSDGDTTSMIVEVSDQGFVWAQMHMTAQIDDGLIQNLDIQDIHLTYWPMN